MPIFELKLSARQLIRENAPKIIYVSLIYVVIITIISSLQFHLPGTSNALAQFEARLSAGELPGLAMLYSNFRPSGVALAVVLWLMLPVIDTGYMGYCMKINRKQAGDFKDILDGFLYFVKILLIFIVTNFFIALWTLLFIFPGIVAVYKYRQAYYILLDAPEKGVMQCIRESKRLIAGCKLDLFLLDISFIGWLMADFAVNLIFGFPFPFPIVLIWLIPYQGLSRAAFYDRLVGNLLV